jgi:D-alanine-D-alanine ligase-like ATP-grasp enzyme
MSALNTERFLAAIVREVAADMGVSVASLGEGWILRLTRGDQIRHIHGYSFDLNSAATHAIACDKAATSQVLTASGVPCVEHRLFLHPELAKYVRHPGNWGGMLEYFERCGRVVVVKDNAGTGGRGVFRASTPVDLESAALSLFGLGRSVALCPFLNIGDETRLIVLDGQVRAAYSKERPTVVGDGRSTVLELLAARVKDSGVSADLARFLGTLDPESAAILSRVPGKGETCLLNWRHNLGQGATVGLVDHTHPRCAPSVSLACDAARALGLTFGSVDVVSVDGRLLVLEVNSGVMMEALAGVPGGRDVARSVYALALTLMFARGGQ